MLPQPNAMNLLTSMSGLPWTPSVPNIDGVSTQQHQPQEAITWTIPSISTDSKYKKFVEKLDKHKLTTKRQDGKKVAVLAWGHIPYPHREPKPKMGETQSGPEPETKRLRDYFETYFKSQSDVAAIDMDQLVEDALKFIEYLRQELRDRVEYIICEQVDKVREDVWSCFTDDDRPKFLDTKLPSWADVKKFMKRSNEQDNHIRHLICMMMIDALHRALCDNRKLKDLEEHIQKVMRFTEEPLKGMTAKSPRGKSFTLRVMKTVTDDKYKATRLALGLSTNYARGHSERKKPLLLKDSTALFPRIKYMNQTVAAYVADFCSERDGTEDPVSLYLSLIHI